MFSHCPALKSGQAAASDNTSGGLRICPIASLDSKRLSAFWARTYSPSTFRLIRVTRDQQRLTELVVLRLPARPNCDDEVCARYVSVSRTERCTFIGRRSFFPTRPSLYPGIGVYFPSLRTRAYCDTDYIHLRIFLTDFARALNLEYRLLSNSDPVHWLGKIVGSIVQYNLLNAIVLDAVPDRLSKRS